MKRAQTLRAALILFLVIAALYYLLPTVQMNMMNQDLEDRLTEVHTITGIPLFALNEQIFRFEVDLVNQIESLDSLDQSQRDAATEQIEYLRGEFYDKYNRINAKVIKLGLDLKGGMHLVLEVNLAELMDNLAKNRDTDFDQIIAEIRKALYDDPEASFESVATAAFEQRSIPMARYFGDPRKSDREILNDLRKQAEEAVKLTVTKLRNRVDEFGVAEPNITQQGNRRIVVELPGVQDPARARNLIGRTALLEFKLVADPSITRKVIEDIDKHLAEEIKAKKSDDPTAKDATPAAKDTTAAPEDTSASSLEKMFAEQASDTSTNVDESAPFSSLLSLYQRQIMVLDRDRTSVERYIGRSEIKNNIIPPDYEFRWSHKSEATGDGKEFWMLYLIKSRAELTGSALADAQVSIGSGYSDPSQAGAGVVNLTMKREGSRKFARVTENNVGEFLAIVLDDKVHMAPRIKVKIPDGRAIIEGSESVEEAKDLAIVLRAGALPAPVEIIEERTVGPSLGEDSIKAGTMSALIGLAGVIVFMVIYYRVSGLIADLALLMNLVFLMAVLAGFGFSLTLPGIAGIILTVGMAVDANVLIFERIREEGTKSWSAIQAGFKRARLAILDANITTLIAGIVLYQFGTGPIRGFALTLMIGIVASVFTALVVSKAIFDWIATRKNFKELSI